MHDSQIHTRRTWTTVRWPRLIMVVLLCLVFVPSAVAQDEPTQDDVNAIARKLFCPVCENTPLDVCPTQACQNWRDEIRVGLIEGMSEQEILDEFALKYGDSVLAQPPARQWVAWALPAAFIVVAFGALVYWLSSWMRPTPVTVANAVREEDPKVSQDDPYLQQLERELAEWET